MSERPDPLAEPEGYGSKLGNLAHLVKQVSPDKRPAWTEDIPGGPEDTICDFADARRVRCTRERTWHWEAGDLAEHMSPIDVCDEHEARARHDMLMGVIMTCTICNQAMTVEHRYPVLPDGSLGEDKGRLSRHAAPDLQIHRIKGEDH